MKILLFLFIANTVYSQTFPVIISSPKDESAVSLVSIDNVNYHTIISYIPASITDSILLFSMNGMGGEITQTFIQNTTNCDAAGMQIRENLLLNQFLAFASCYDPLQTDFQSYILKLESNFTAFLQDTIGSPEVDEVIWDIASDSSGTLFLSGYEYFAWEKAYIYQYSTTLESEKKMFFTNLPPYYPYTMSMIGMFNYETTNQLTGFFIFSNSIVKIDKDSLTVAYEQELSYDSSFLSLRKPIFISDAKKYFIPFQQKEGLGLKTKVNIVVADTNFNLISSHSFEDINHNLSIALDAIDYIDSNNIWIALTPYATPDPNFEEVTHFIKVVKMNSAGEVITETNFGGDANYVAQAIKATPDGGALIMCERYDWTVQDHERDIYIYKIDSAGNLVNTAVDIEPAQEQKDILVFPNPAHDVLYFQSAMHTDALIEIFDMQGRKIQEQYKNTFEMQMDISALAAGIYLYKISVETGLIKTGKFVKD